MEIKTDDLFDSEFDKCVDYALLEFGRKTAKKWIDSLIAIKHQLRLMPERYSFVPELQKWRKYRGAIIMKNFKIIYFYNEEKDILWLVDLWDMRQDPRKLNMRARRIERSIISLYDKQKNPPGVPTDFESGRTSGGMFVWSCILQRLIHFFPIYQSLALFIEFHCQGDDLALVGLEWFCVALFLYLALGSRNAAIVR